jgi:hypothetical protein
MTELLLFDLNSGLPIDGNIITRYNKDMFDLICLKCQSAVFLRGEKLIHKNKTCINEDIKLATKKLTNYIKTGGNILLKCNMCKSSKILNLSGCIVKTRYMIGAHKVNIVIVNNYNKIRYILDMQHIHKTPVKVEKWCELRASEVITALTHPGKMANLTNIKRCTCINSIKSIRQLAIELGYCIVNDEWDSSYYRLRILTKPTNNYKLTYMWNTRFTYETKKPSWAEAWIDFMKLGKCLKCEESTQIGLGRPFCVSCKNTILSNNTEIVILPLSQDALNIFKYFFDWLKKLPDAKEVKTGLCSICKENNLYIWYYSYRPICINCVVQNHNVHFAHENFFSSPSHNLEYILDRYSK